MPNVNGMQFPYTPEGIAQAKQAQMGSGGPQNFDQNPFEAILAQGQPMPTAAPNQVSVQASPNGVPAEEEGPEELQPGKTGDNSKPLLAAIHNLHNYISMTTNPGDIRLIRNLISALTQVVARDQQRSAEQMQAQPPAAPPVA